MLSFQSLLASLDILLLSYQRYFLFSVGLEEAISLWRSTLCLVHHKHQQEGREG